MMGEIWHEVENENRLVYTLKTETTYFTKLCEITVVYDNIDYNPYEFSHVRIELMD